MSHRRFANLRLYGRLLREARPYWLHIAGISFVRMLAIPLALLAPVPLKIAVDSLVGTAAVPAVLRPFLPDSAAGSVWPLLIMTASLMLCVGVAEQLQAYGAYLLETSVGEKLVLGFRAKLFRHVQRLSLAYHDGRGTTDSIYRIQYDAPAIQTIAVSGVVPLISAILTLLAMLVIIVRLDWMLAAVACCAMPFLLAAAHLSVTRLKGSWKGVKELESSAMSVLQEALGAIRVVKAFSREDHEQGRYVDRSNRRVREMIGAVTLQMKFDTLVATIIMTATALTLCIGVLHVKSGAITLGSLLLIIGYMSQLFGPMQTMSQKTSQLQASFAGAERAFALLDEVPDVAETPGARRLSRARGAIAFRRVTFGYSADSAVLQDVSFEVDAGARVGVEGRTGAGKTTLLNLLMRFYDPVSGEILLDGLDVRGLKLADLRNQFAIVHQEPVLFSTSIADNIAYARPDASVEDIERAARAASAHDFIGELPLGYDTIVGERGMRLSGGERQRIALARAFLKDAPILLLDEPTSSVDIKTEALIIEAMDRLMVGRTTFMIAHRLATLERCNVRLRVDMGHVSVSNPAGAFLSSVVV